MVIKESPTLMHNAAELIAFGQRMWPFRRQVLADLIQLIGGSATGFIDVLRRQGGVGGSKIFRAHFGSGLLLKLEPVLAFEESACSLSLLKILLVPWSRRRSISSDLLIPARLAIPNRS